MYLSVERRRLLLLIWILKCHLIARGLLLLVLVHDRVESPFLLVGEIETSSVVHPHGALGGLHGLGDHELGQVHGDGAVGRAQETVRALEDDLDALHPPHAHAQAVGQVAQPLVEALGAVKAHREFGKQRLDFASSPAAD